MVGFFSLVGAAFSHLEESPQVPGFELLSKKDTSLTLTGEVNRLSIRDSLRSYISDVIEIPPQALKGILWHRLRMSQEEKQARSGIWIAKCLLP